MSKEYFLAIDLGASSGRHIVCEKNSSELIEVYRFKHQVIEKNQHKYWNLPKIWDEIKKGIAIACERFHVVSLGIDTWAVDYVLIDEDGSVDDAFAYRDPRTKDVIDEVHKIIPFEDLYKHTGIQFQPFNTIYQLYWDRKFGRLTKNKKILMLPEYFYYKLTGQMVNEYTNATSTGFVDINKKEYHPEILKLLGIDKSHFSKLHQPGYIMKPLEKIKNELNFDGNIVLVATHDTASAVEGIDIGKNNIYLSSGTWSLLGVKIDTPILTNFSRNLNYSHEGGVGYLRFQKNIMGLWIIEELMRDLKIDAYEKMVEMAKSAQNIYIFNVNDERLFAPCSMLECVKNLINEKFDIIDINNSDLINSVYHSLAKSYKDAIEELEQLTHSLYREFYIFGGGTKNVYFNELIEKYTNKLVIVLPTEATAIGNIKIQKEVLK